MSEIYKDDLIKMINAIGSEEILIPGIDVFVEKPKKENEEENDSKWVILFFLI